MIRLLFGLVLCSGIMYDSSMVYDRTMLRKSDVLVVLRGMLRRWGFDPYIAEKYLKGKGKRIKVGDLENLIASGDFYDFIENFEQEKYIL